MKKFSYLFILFIALFVFVNPVFANYITCAGVQIDTKIVNAVHVIILIIQIVVPILLVIFGSIDFLKAVIGQKDDEIKKGQQTFIKRLIAAVIVFFVVAIVRLLVSFAAGDEDKSEITNCFNSFINGSDGKNSNNSSDKNSNSSGSSQKKSNKSTGDKNVG